jgi:hypothetical protein
MRILIAICILFCGCGKTLTVQENSVAPSDGDHVYRVTAADNTLDSAPTPSAGVTVEVDLSNGEKIMVGQILLGYSYEISKPEATFNVTRNVNFPNSPCGEREVTVTIYKDDVLMQTIQLDCHNETALTGEL